MAAPAQLTAEVVRNVLRQVKDPELDMNIIDLGLVYDEAIAEGDVEVRMTLTAPGCPAGPMITNDAYKVFRALHGVARGCVWFAVALGRGVFWPPRAALDARQLSFGERERPPHALEQRGAVAARQRRGELRDRREIRGRAGQRLRHG